MLGIARHAQYAGWGVQAPEITDTTVTTGLVGNLLQRPSYFADFTGVTYVNAGGGFDVPSGSTAFDMTGIGTNSKQQIWSTTFRVGSSWMTTAPTTGFYNGPGVFHILNNNTTTNFISVGMSKNENQYFFGLPYGPGVGFTAAEFDANLRNRWLTLVACTSTTPVADFSTWSSGPSDFSGFGWGTQTVLIDTETGAILSENNGWNYSDFGMDLTQSWVLGDTGTYRDNHFIYFDGDISQYHRNDIDFLSHWVGFGGTLDPVVQGALVTGPAIGSTVSGTRAWVQWDMTSAGTLLTNSNSIDYGYKQTVGGNGSRMPSNTEFTITADGFASSPQTIPAFINR